MVDLMAYHDLSSGRSWHGIHPMPWVYAMVGHIGFFMVGAHGIRWHGIEFKAVKDPL